MTEVPFPVLLVTHPGMGEGLLHAAAAIVGETEGVDLITNRGLDRPALEREVQHWLASHPGPVIVLTDLGFGSCGQAAHTVARGRGDVGLVDGINLPVLLAVLRPRTHGGLPALMEHLRGRAEGSVCVTLTGAST